MPTADQTHVYDIVVRAIASRFAGDTGPAETVDTPVAVTVTDVDEDGEVVISLLQPEVGIEIMASLTDSDGGRHRRRLAVGSLRSRGECP